MTLLHYNQLAPKLLAKKRGRLHEANVCTAPELWAKLDTYDNNIYVTYMTSRVATLRPDNSLTIDIGHWHTQTSVKIIYELTRHSAWVRKNHIWTHGSPTQNGRLDYDFDRQYITPMVCLELRDKVSDRLDRVTPYELPDKGRLRLEIGSWQPVPAITEKVLAYALGKADVATLGARDIWTCIHDKDAITARCLEKELA